MKHHNVEQNTQAWIDLRCGLPTASQAARLVTPTGKLSTAIVGYAEELVIEKLTGKQFSQFAGNDATNRGHELEPAAAAWYAYETDQDVTTCGFFTDTLRRYGASPDRLVPVGNGLVELKSQEDKGHLSTYFKYQRTGDIPADYYAQTQMQLYVCEADWLDLVLYHPTFPKSIIRVVPDLSFQNKLASQLDVIVNHRDEMLSTLLEAAA